MSGPSPPPLRPRRGASNRGKPLATVPLARHAPERWTRFGAFVAVLLALLGSACGRSGSPDAEPPGAPAGTDARQAPAETRGDRPRGRWSRSREATALTESQRQQIERLRAIGYLAGSQPAPALSGVTAHDRVRAFRGLNFYTSGHAPEAVLMDMDGNVVHRWRYEFRDAFPDHPHAAEKPDKYFWRRARLFDNGDILAIHEGLGLLKLDSRSRLLWARPITAHHDLQVSAEGDIWVLTREPRLVPRISETRPILEDFVTVLGPDGVDKQRFSLLECFENSASEHSWIEAARVFWQKERTRRLADNPGDIFHTNSLELLDGRIADRAPEFRRGNLLLSMCHLDMIAVVDPRQRRVVWSMSGSFALQHDPRVLPDGNLILFDNNWKTNRSAVTVLDPVTRRTVWQYRGTDERPFYSRTCGAAIGLPNGNTLITESDYGRAFEVTPEQEIVWEYYNLHRAGEGDEYIATLFEMVRLDPGFPVDWVGGR